MRRKCKFGRNEIVIKFTRSSHEIRVVVIVVYIEREREREREREARERKCEALPFCSSPFLSCVPLLLSF
ncbi:hypothetical protein RJT34_31833 [Clitoria ternatea]|uniref:Uncharacterized protein n=1 Tax=Clitoria ternatea TaxID=43366 RepID=A0AAN9EUX5_CLITE